MSATLLAMLGGVLVLAELLRVNCGFLAVWEPVGCGEAARGASRARQ